MREVVRQANPVARILLVLAAAFLLLTCVSLAKRAWRGDTDFGVFYRASVALAAGAGGEIYAQRDAPSGWYNCIPPAGMSVFMGLSFFHRLAAGIIWALFNLGLLAACFELLRRIYRKLGDHRVHYEATLPYALIVLAVFGGVCLQTGQTSILFVVCWLGYVLSTTYQKNSWCGFLLALPAAIKLYPVIFGVVPLLRRKWAEVSWGVVWIGILTLLVPAIIFRENVIELTTSFFQHQVFDPNGRVMTAAGPTAVSNQGLDAVLLRYLSFVPGLHDQSGAMPHANIDPELVIFAANLMRVAVLVFTAIISVRFIRKPSNEPPLMLMALWCAALYMILPGAKGRYAIYALPAILAMFAAAHRQYANVDAKEGFKLAALSVASCALLIQLFPDYLLQFGVGFIGTLILWLFVVKETIAATVLASGARENYASGGKRASDIF